MNENIKDVNCDRSSNETATSSNTQELFDLIQNLQSKLDNENHEDTYNEPSKNKELNNDNNYKIENSNNIVEKKTSSENSENSENNGQDKNSSNGFDFSALGSILQNVDISQVLNMFGSNTNSKDTKSSSDTSFLGGIDPKMLLKMQRIMSSMNKEDPKKNLLLSLKPFLRKSRQDKLNEYVSMLTIVKALEAFGSKGSDD